MVRRFLVTPWGFEVRVYKVCLFTTFELFRYQLEVDSGVWYGGYEQPNDRTYEVKVYHKRNWYTFFKLLRACYGKNLKRNNDSVLLR